MSLQELIDGLSRPEMYGCSRVRVHQTHISVVFVTDRHAFKLKKPVDFGFVDYSTPDDRRAMCEAEVRLNRRLAADVYIGVRSVVRDGDAFAIADADHPDAVDWVVMMKRLHDEDRFLARLHEGTLEPSQLVKLGQMLAVFHAECERGEPGRYGSFETVAKNARENFSQALEQVGHTVAPAVFEAARAATDAQLEMLRPLIESRDRDGCTRDTHGDLRLEHIYDLDGELVVVDCIEFNDAFRYADPVADIAFLAMDLRIRWATDLADVFTEAYFAQAGGGEALVDFYVAYRSAVRAKVHGMAALEPELDGVSRERAFTKSRAHWLFTWSTLAPPIERPALVIVGGLPGTGKSTLARMLRDEAGFQMFDSDHVRKELAGVAPDVSMRDAIDAGIYTAEWTERTYTECLRRATEIVHAGGRAVISATFRQEQHRAAFLQAAHAAGVAGHMLLCELPRDEVVRRIESRRGDASDADVATYEHVASAWEEASDFVARRCCAIETSTIDETRSQAMEALQSWSLATA